MRYIKLFESKKEDEDTQHDMEDFASKLVDVQNYFDRNTFPQFRRSYSSIAKLSYERRYFTDPENDFNLVNDKMCDLGWDFDRSKLLYKNYSDINGSFCGDILSNGDSMCAPTDYYLYKLTDGEFPLQGIEWDEFYGGHDYLGDESEFTIKFSYGWHLTKYGRLCILQNMSMLEFFKKSNENISTAFIDLIKSAMENYCSQLVNHEIDKYFIVQENYVYIDIGLYEYILTETSIIISEDRFIEVICDFFKDMCEVTVIGKSDIRLKFKK